MWGSSPSAFAHQASIIPFPRLPQDTIDGLTSQLEAFQAKMKRVEESILSRDYKKHIQVSGSSPGAFPPESPGKLGSEPQESQTLFKDRAQT